jgi:Zn-dependent peptidase ImmA (M78 family)/transcriptional regulator with XRE-family HTH domain
MTLDVKIRPEVLGARLRNARVNARLTQEAAAQATGIARTTIAAMESGKRTIDTRQLRTFAQVYQVAEVELLGRDQQPLDLEVKFRSSLNAPVTDDQAVVARQLTRLASGALELESLVSRQPAKQDYPAVRLDRDEGLEQQAEDAAMALRQRLGLGIGPISNLLQLIESELGVRVFERPLPSEISGAVAYDPAHGGFIILNANHPIERRRLTAAHECGHPLLRKPGVTVLRVGDEDYDREERFCDAFARALLMPAAAVRRKHSELRDVSGKFTVRHIIVLALYFMVSVEAMTRRLETLSIVQRGMYESLREKGLTSEHTKSVMQEITNEPAPTFTPHTYFLAGAAIDRDLLSIEQVAQLLDTDLVSVRRLLTKFSSEGEEVLEFQP